MEKENLFGVLNCSGAFFEENGQPIHDGVDAEACGALNGELRCFAEHECLMADRADEPVEVIARDGKECHTLPV